MSWDILGTNLSVKFGESNDGWTTETDRLLLLDSEEFDQLGIGLDDLIDGYIQTILAVVSIDKMCQRLTVNGKFDTELFSSLNPDKVLISEILNN